jgi:uncharacterized membrane protein
MFRILKNTFGTIFASLAYIGIIIFYIIIVIPFSFFVMFKGRGWLNDKMMNDSEIIDKYIL